MEKTNFFIIGAPKCGTTALAQWLSAHPDIFMPPVKEPHFYSKDLANQQAPTRAEYDRLFKGATTQHKAVGEASVWYLYSKEAVSNILSEIPDAKFIVSLRNPIDMAYSLHRQQIVATNETIEDFNKAWNAQGQRKQGINIPRRCEDPRLLLYGQICMLGMQMDLLFTTCKREQVYVAFLDDIEIDAKAVYEDILDYLKVPSDHRTSFEVVNVASQRRSMALARSIKSVNLARQRIGIPRLGTGLMPLMDRLNRRKCQQSAMNGTTRDFLKSYFEEDIQLLERVLNRQLRNWRQ